MINLDADVPLVHQTGNLGIFKTLVLHHMAPVTRTVPDGEKDRPLVSPRSLNRRITPRPPIHRIPGMLQQVWASFVGEFVGHGMLLDFEVEGKFVVCGSFGIDVRVDMV